MYAHGACCTQLSLNLIPDAKTKSKTIVGYKFYTGILEVFFSPHELEARLRVFVALDVQLLAQRLGTAEENTSFCGSMDLADRAEDKVPVGAAKVCRRAEPGDGVLFGVGVVNHDVCRLVGLEFGGQIL